MTAIIFVCAFLAGSASTAVGILLGAYLFKAHPEILDRVKQHLPRRKLKILDISHEEAVKDLNDTL